MQGAEISQISTFVLVSRQKFSGNSDFHPEILCFPLCTGDDRSAAPSPFPISSPWRVRNINTRKNALRLVKISANSESRCVRDCLEAASGGKEGTDEVLEV